MQIIDPHLHLFNLAQGEYAWLRAQNPPHWPDKAKICRDFGDVALELSTGLELAGYVHIEAGFDNAASWREIDWVEAQTTKSVRSVGHIDLLLAPEQFATALHQLQQRTSLVGIRHIFDTDIARLATNPNTLENLQLIAKHDLHFELQIELQYESTQPLSLALISSLPTLNFVLNHAGFCPIDPSDNDYDNEIGKLATLAKCPNLSVKASGFEMVNRQFSTEHAARLIARLCDYFGDERVMLASNFPLITLSRTYSDYWTEMTEALSRSQLPLQRLVCENAKRIYRFDSLGNNDSTSPSHLASV